MIQMICLLNTFSTPLGLPPDLRRIPGPVNRGAVGDCVLDEGSGGDPSVVRYPGGASSSSSDLVSSRFASPALGKRMGWAGF